MASRRETDRHMLRGLTRKRHLLQRRHAGDGRLRPVLSGISTIMERMGRRIRLRQRRSHRGI